MNESETCAILLSGGMDSSALAYLMRPRYGVFIDYGQRAAEAEERAAIAIAKEVSVDLQVIRIDLSTLGTGVMAGTAQVSAATSPEWWPFRNQMLITLAAMRMIGLNLKHLYIGTVATDRLHRDNSAEFMETMNVLLGIQEGAVKVLAPARHLTTAALITEANMPWSTLAWSHSCHTSIYPCGQCRGCAKRGQVLEELGWS